MGYHATQAAKAIKTIIDGGHDPRPRREQIAELICVPLAVVDAAIEAAVIPEPEALRLSYESRVYGVYDGNPPSDHDED
jgi:hypothetical protein